MSYAIVQTTLGKPPEDALKRAFSEVPWLTDLDAGIMARDAYGVIVEGLTYAQAERISAALDRAGVSQQMVSQQDLPKPGMRRQLRRMECASEGPVIYDPLGRPVNGQWSDVKLIAAGLVGMKKMQRIEKQRVKYRGTGWRGGVVPVVVTDVSEKQVGVEKLVMEIYLGREPSRFRIIADEFQYNYLGDRLRPSFPENFALLVQDVARYAPHAQFSQGVKSLLDDQVTTYGYPTEHAFTEEITWLLWMSKRNAANPA